ncbi:MAG: AraC family transcriptional regulator [Shewanella xiamenensis]|uniref:AraC family transcriptional regulator n=1 Tax=Shewanella TaxID=22 RepID=UPI0006DAEAD0|nr:MULTISPECIES: AraC family transcriptional regulator [Shewanella]KPN75100.1 AraC family transcriptional regulator [Shewanella sp. Sh95]MCD8559051.1 AraC family transcriptional regulator [Shewanella xiamenensis]MDI5851365.1 AraC family transcriptional regulator [Shewanella xiamenensis]MDI5855080.1 AraC family transcriptional regulator [Shewanella xiamenensis]MDI5863294.1 AraC family transcriptional regulator [Shewanella xiamenensis]
MLQRVDYKTNLMVGDQTYPAFELRNILDFIASQLGEKALQQVCGHIGVGRTELNHCQFVFVWQVEYAMEFLRLQGGDPDIGTKLGLSYRVSSLDVLLPHLAQLSSLQACLQFVINHPSLVGSFTDSLVRLTDDSVCIRWLNTGRIDKAQYGFQFLHSIGSLLGLARELTGEAITLSQINLVGSGRDCHFLEEATGAKVQFNCEYYEWSISLDYLALAINYPFPKFAEITPSAFTTSFIETVLIAIRAHFPHVLHLDEMAAQLHMSDRSFRRKLAQLGSSYQRLVDQVRCQRAVELILANKLDIEAIAETLGYSDVSHFRQSFKHWIGHPPGYFSRLNCG